MHAFLPPLRLATAVMAVMFCFCTGCDGIYSYSCEGTLYQPDGITPAAGVPLRISPYRPTTNESPAHGLTSLTDSSTDSSGHFSATFQLSTFWVFTLRPPPPTLSELFLIFPTQKSIRIDLKNTDQPLDPVSRRHIHLPKVILPPQQ